MRGVTPEYELITPKNLKEALSTLDSEPDKWSVFAGGTDLMVFFESGDLPAGHWLNIWPFEELRGIEVSEDSVTLGGLTTYQELQDHPVVQKEFPSLCHAARLTGAMAIQNRGTLGGNIMNASPAADSPPALLAYDAEIELIAKESSRWVKYCDFHLDYKKTLASPNEILSKIKLPRTKEALLHYYRKVGTRNAQAISKVVFSGCAQKKGEELKNVRIALGSVGPKVIRCLETEKLIEGGQLSQELIENAQKKLCSEITPIDDIRSTCDYRLKVAQNLLGEWLNSCGTG